MASIRLKTCFSAPLPTETMMITDETPITMPSKAKAVLILWAASCLREILRLRAIFIFGPLSWPRGDLSPPFFFSAFGSGFQGLNRLNGSSPSGGLYAGDQPDKARKNHPEDYDLPGHGHRRLRNGF